ncbi:nitroreductase family deazaflavin-dependent oxidoreductase [Actinotalea sp.]|uniref:nitroreductase family deazaflavin-dependent oxidoreductase n=1 Tax=Actinotalea sp. TaxID=1872145 RepID=UPI002CF79380|nr:nitroreductase family deazaflavin-dependent oxidoreductase [Actinotalea sp.]HQY34580.1 nitroreductase family deazaflavin-dependent oxidoreductase [Actinotalea sp.]HRA51597.1 nitroreductase family deazaflavin-dependent oxidoreductase [Actinotalea sp.]
MTSRGQIAFTRLHAVVYRATGGRVGGRLGSLEQVLLTTRGRRSGQQRTIPLAGIRDGERLLLVASNGGADQHPAWYLNLQADPTVVVQSGARRDVMVARTADAVERPGLWRTVVAANPGYGRYATRTQRTIPVVVCEPERLDPPAGGVEP